MKLDNKTFTNFIDELDIWEDLAKVDPSTHKYFKKLTPIDHLHLLIRTHQGDIIFSRNSFRAILPKNFIYSSNKVKPNAYKVTVKDLCKLANITREEINLLIERIQLENM